MTMWNSAKPKQWLNWAWNIMYRNDNHRWSLYVLMVVHFVSSLFQAWRITFNLKIKEKLTFLITPTDGETKYRMWNFQCERWTTKTIPNNEQKLWHYQLCVLPRQSIECSFYCIPLIIIGVDAWKHSMAAQHLIQLICLQSNENISTHVDYKGKASHMKHKEWCQNVGNNVILCIFSCDAMKWMGGNELN